jgi:hypothetical protein
MLLRIDHDSDMSLPDNQVSGLRVEHAPKLVSSVEELD